MKLFKHQEEFLKRKMDKGLLVWSCGSGKTLASLLWTTGDKLLIICPKTLVVNWMRKISEVFEVESVDMNKKKTCCVVSLKDKRTFTIWSKEHFKANIKDTPDFNVKEIIADEVHYFSGIKSNLYKTLKTHLMRHPEIRFLGLTGTPYLSTPLNIFAYGQLLGRKEYEWSYIYFIQRYFFQKFFGATRVNLIKSDIEDIMSDRVAEIADVVHMRDCVDVPDDVFEEEYFDLTISQQKEWDKIFDPNPIVSWTKKHQLCGGSIKGDEYVPNIITTSDKFDRAIELCQNNKKVIVVCRYTLELHRLSEELNRLGIENSIVNGEEDDKQSVIDKADKADRHILLVNAACSEGWEAKSFNTMIFYSYDFSLKNYVQMKARMQRIDAIQKCTYISLITQKTIDEDVYKKVVIKKQGFHVAVYNRKHAEKGSGIPDQIE